MEQTFTLNTIWVLICSVLVLLTQAGFLCLESGQASTKNTINVAIKNISDFSISVLLFWMLGFGLMFGTSYYGVIGNDFFFTPIQHMPTEQVAHFVFFSMFCATAATILSGAVAGRLRFNAYIYCTVILSLIVFPVFGHWAWGTIQPGAIGWLAEKGFVDFAGSTVVHSIGAWAALAAVLVIGPRLGQYNDQGIPRESPGYSQPMAMLGGLLMWLGWLGFTGGSSQVFSNQTPSIIVTTLLSGCAATVSALCLSLFVYGKTKLRLVINGSLAGLVGITAACHAVSSPMALLIGISSVLIMHGAQVVLDRYQIDDALGVIPVHGAVGVWGTLAVALFADLNSLATGLSRWEQFQVQLLGAACAFGLSFGVSYSLLRVINRFYPLRVSADEELQGLNISEHGAPTELSKLLAEMEAQRQSGNFKRRVQVDMYSDVGQIAEQYNQVLDVVNEESEKVSSTMAKLEVSWQQAVKTTRQLREAKEYTNNIINSMSDTLVVVKSDGTIISANGSTLALLGYQERELLGQPADMIMPDLPYKHDKANSLDVFYQAKDGRQVPMLFSCSRLHDADGEPTGYVCVAHDASERKRAEAKQKQLEDELAQAHKLESVGQLAAGIAHEINTPVQYVGDNIRFLQDAFDDIGEVLSSCQRVLHAGGTSVDGNLAEAKQAYEQADIEYLASEIPAAIDQSLSGVQQVTKIVGAMKEFSHPGCVGKDLVDLNSCVETSVTISTNEWKHLAEVSTELDPDLPEILGAASELNQVILNLVVNAAHAIEEHLGKQESLDEKQGRILITTRQDDDWVLMSISDNGPGIPDELRNKIFDPFFTTKEVGKGTGQGLSIARSVIVDKHGGSIEIAKEASPGTTFLIRLPIAPADSAANDDI